MKNDFLHSSLKSLNIMLSPVNIKKLSRAQKSTLKKSKSSSNSIQYSTSLNINSKYLFESEKLCQEKFQLINVVKKLKLQLYFLKRQNKEIREQIKVKDNKIKNIVDKNDNNLLNKNIYLIKKIKKQIEDLKCEIKEIDEKSSLMKKNEKLTKLNEYEIEKISLEEQINKINNLLLYSNNINDIEKNKFDEYNKIQEKINSQNKILESLKDEMNLLDEEEKMIKEEIENIHLKIKEEKNKIEINNEIVNSLKKNNTILNNKNNQNNGINYNKNIIYKEEIIKIKKALTIYKNKYKFQELVINDLQTESKKLLEINENKKKNSANLNEFIVINKKSLISSINNNYKEEEDEIQKLKKDLEQSKLIENELEKQIKQYKQKLNELKELNPDKTIEQIEFGIDTDNPFYINDEENDILKTRKITNVQFNQFTYILFKNFEAKHLTLKNSGIFLIDDLYEDSNYNNKNSENKVDITSESFNHTINVFSKKICEALNCKNENSIIKLKIYLGALLYNSKGRINKFTEYLKLLFSYIIDYSSEMEENLKKEMINNHKKNCMKLINCLKNEKANEEYIPLLDFKDIIDNNLINFDDRYIEYIYYVMKQFDDPKANLEDLKLSNFYNLLNIKEENNKKESQNNNDESMTEITNEEYYKNINLALSQVNEGLKKNNYNNINEIIKDSIKLTKDKGINLKTISIEDLNEHLKKINVILSDLQLSCLCSKFAIPEDLRIINVKNFEESLKNYSINKTGEFDKSNFNFEE